MLTQGAGKADAVCPIGTVEPTSSIFTGLFVTVRPNALKVFVHPRLKVVRWLISVVVSHI